MKNKTWLILLLLTLITPFLSGCDSNKSTITFNKFSVILPPPVASGTSAYGIIKNTGDTNDTLVAITSNAGSVMLHKSEVINGSAKMIHLSEYTFKPHTELTLKPMSYHIMLMQIDHDIIKEKGTVLLSFEFKKAGIINVEAPVSLEPLIQEN